MKGSRLSRHYAQLDPLERFRLVVAAFARDDERELERLERSCPRERYRACEAAFLDRLELSREVVLVVAAELQRPLGKLELLAALTGPVDPQRSPLGPVAVFLAHAGEDAAFAAYCAAPPTQAAALAETIAAAARPAGERLLALLARIEHDTRRAAAAYAHGFARFCERELELDPLVLLAAFAPSFRDELASLLAEAPDEQLASSYADGLSDGWRSRLGLPPHPSTSSDGGAQP